MIGLLTTVDPESTPNHGLHLNIESLWAVMLGTLEDQAKTHTVAQKIQVPKHHAIRSQKLS